MQQYWRERGFPDHAFPGSFDLGHPEIRFDQLAREHGRAGHARGDAPTRSRPRSSEALAEDGPFLIDLLLHQEVPDHDEDAANRRPVAGTRAHS